MKLQRLQYFSRILRQVVQQSFQILVSLCGLKKEMLCFGKKFVFFHYPPYVYQIYLYDCIRAYFHYIICREHADVNGRTDPRMSFGSCPVLHGTKLGINKKYFH